MPKSEKRKAKAAPKEKRKPKVSTNHSHAKVKDTQKSVPLERDQFTDKPFKFTNNAGVTKTLTPKQYRFCIVYLEERGNAVEAVIEAGYDCNYPNSKTPNRKLAAQIGYENLMKPDICEFITLKLREYGFADDNVELQHLYLMNQNADLGSKAKAVDMYYNLKDRYPKQKIDVNHTFDTVEIKDYGTKAKQNNDTV